jgi:hypothetical protein
VQRHGQLRTSTVKLTKQLELRSKTSLGLRICKVQDEYVARARQAFEYRQQQQLEMLRPDPRMALDYLLNDT